MKAYFLRTLAACILLVTTSGLASAANLIVNPGFETGDLTGWTTFLPGTGGVVGVTGSSHSGTYAAYWEDQMPGAFDFLSQTVATTPGELYRVSFWGANGFEFNPSAFAALFDGTLLVDIFNPAQFNYSQYTFYVVATGSSATLVFQAYHVIGAFELDDVLVEIASGGGPFAFDYTGSLNAAR